MPTSSPAPVTEKTKPSHHKNLAQYGKLGGRPKNAKAKPSLQDETQAFDSIRDKWTYISHRLADKALAAARSTKNINGKELVALCTSAGIAYDKRWSKATADTTEVAMPASLVSEIAKACTLVAAKPAINNDVSVLGQVRDMDGDDALIVLPAIDPAALDPGG